MPKKKHCFGASGKRPSKNYLNDFLLLCYTCNMINLLVLFNYNHHISPLETRSTGPKRLPEQPFDFQLHQK